MRLKNLRLAIIPVLALPLVSLAATNAVAEEDADTVRAQLEAKQAELGLRLARLDEVNRAHGLYKLARDGAFYGEHGVKAETDAIYRDTMAWLTKFEGFVRFVQGTRDLGAFAVQEQVRATLREQETEWTALRHRVADLHDRVVSLRASTASVPTLGGDKVAGYGEQTKALDERVRELAQAADRADGMASEELLDAWTRASSAVSDLVKLLIEAQMADSPLLREALSNAEEMFRAERVATPLIQATDHAFVALRTAVNGYRPFEAKRLLDALDREGARAKTELVAAHLAPKYLDEATLRITKLLDAGHTLYDGVVPVLPKRALVKRLFTRSGNELSATCRDDARRATVDCERFQRVFALPKTRIDAMSDAELEVLENEIARIARGPLPKPENVSP